MDGLHLDWTPLWNYMVTQHPASSTVCSFLLPDTLAFSRTFGTLWTTHGFNHVWISNVRLAREVYVWQMLPLHYQGDGHQTYLVCVQSERTIWLLLPCPSGKSRHPPHTSEHCDNTATTPWHCLLWIALDRQQLVSGRNCCNDS